MKFLTLMMLYAIPAGCFQELPVYDGDVLTRNDLFATT